MMDNFSYDYDNYNLRGAIGFGAASVVYSAVHNPTSPPERPRAEPSVCAIKISTRHPDVGQWLEEVRILSACRHPNVLQIYAAFTIPPEHYQVAIVTPLIAGGSLLSLMAWRATLPSDEAPSGLFQSLSGRRAAPATGGLTEEEIKAVLKQVLSGLAYLHVQGIAHRDIKAGNILVDADGTVLLADLGVGVRLSGEGEGEPHAGLVGSPCWMAPEVITSGSATWKSDIWSLGITLIEVSTGRAPLAHLPPARILMQIAASPAPTLPPYMNASKAYLSFLDCCLAKDPADRTAVGQLEWHPFLKSARKPAWLAEALLKGVPPLVHRQEIRRIPSHQSLHSLASSWNFNATPSASALNSPVRTTHRLPRSPSTSTSASGQSHLHMPRTRSISRTSFGYSTPSSPKASLSRASWMMSPSEATPRGRSGEGSMSRAGSEPGRKRTTSLSFISPQFSPVIEPSPNIAVASSLQLDTAGVVSALAMSVPMEPSITSLSAETDPRPTTPEQERVSEPEVIQAGTSLSPPEGRKGLFSRRWSVKAKQEGGEEGSKFVKTLRGFRGVK